MDGMKCDRHPSAWAKARILLANLGTLYMCGHCVDQFGRDYHGEYHVDYDKVTV